MSAKESNVEELVQHFAENGDIAAYSSGLEGLVESRVKALVEAHKAEQIREQFGLQEAVEPEPDEVTSTDDGPETENPDSESGKEPKTPDQDQEQDQGADDESESKSEHEREPEVKDETESKDERPSHITESFKAFARKRK